MQNNNGQPFPNPQTIASDKYEPFIPNAQQNQQAQQPQQNQQQSQQQNSKQMGSKDLGMIGDMLNHEALAYKKCSVYANYFDDANLKNMACTAAKHHKQHYDVLQQYLASHQ